MVNMRPEWQTSAQCKTNFPPLGYPPLDSQLLVATSSVVRDVYDQVIRRGNPLEQRRLALYSRILVVVLVAAALAFGMLSAAMD
jgi:Na+/proline symporter